MNKTFLLQGGGYLRLEFAYDSLFATISIPTRSGGFISCPLTGIVLPQDMTLKELEYHCFGEKMEDKEYGE